MPGIYLCVSGLHPIVAKPTELPRSIFAGDVEPFLDYEKRAWREKREAWMRQFSLRETIGCVDHWSFRYWLEQ